MKKLSIFCVICLLIFSSIYSMEVSNFSDKSTSNLIEELKNKYEIKECEDCIISVGKKFRCIDKLQHNLDKRNVPLEQRMTEIVNFELVCVLAGFKDVYHFDSDYATTMRLLDERIKLILSRSDCPIKISKINYISPVSSYNLVEQCYAYTPKGERNMYLLTKYELQMNLGQILQNQYLFGKLLNYPEEDLEFFTQRNSFKLYFFNIEIDPNDTRPVIQIVYEELVKTGKDTLKADYFQWSDDQKKAFEKWEKDVWPKSIGFQKFLAQKEDAQRWMNENKDKQISDLQLDISALVSQSLLLKIQVLFNENIQLKYRVATQEAEINNLKQQISKK